MTDEGRSAMRGFLITITALSGLCAAIATAADPPSPGRPGANAGAFLFRFADSNRDGRLDQDEFLKATERFPRLKDNPELAKQLFQRLDKDGDGVLSMDEFRAMMAVRPGLRPPPADPVKPTDDKPASDEQIAFFEKKIRPLFEAHCISCHSATAGKVQGGLALDSREGLREGGVSGPAIVPGSPEKSLLITAVHYKDDSLKMPPRTKLPAAALADLEQWVRIGAPDPRGQQAKQPHAEPKQAAVTHWAFQKPIKHEPPPLSDATWARDPIDQFVLAGLEAKGLKPTSDAPRRDLIRRVTLDLTGLPPTPEEITAFLADSSTDAYAKVVDRLLKSPAFGERWGRHWLDVARYAESTGQQVNHNYPYAWRYRDYVIASFNADKPFDRFIREQLAGDLLPAADEKQKAELTIATGFLALGPKALNERNALQFEMDVVDEQIDTTTQAFLGVTAACARCHDHKFDPIPTSDYYALAGVFRSTQTCYGTVRMIQSQRPAPLLELSAASGVPAGAEPLSDAERQRLKNQIAQANQGGRLGGANINNVIRQRIITATAQARLDAYEADGQPKLRAMGVREKSFAVDSPIYTRGEVDKPASKVTRALPQSLGLTPPTIDKGSGRRELADWIASPENPLTARVFVNRVWLHLFGRGLVPTPDNFGTAGTAPTHPELLDWLAVTFVEDGWSTKSLIRRLVLSRTYQQGSQANPAALEIDPENRMLWRFAPRRLDAESLRDALLAVSGRLDLTPPRGSPITKAGDGYTQGYLRFSGSAEERYRGRSLYLPMLRGAVPEALALFDMADPSMVIAERHTTIIPAQGLFLLNSPLVMNTAEAAAARVLEQPGDDAARLTVAYERFLGRPPSATELADARTFLADYTRTLAAVKGGAGPTEAWTALCQALFASAEFLYVR